MGSDFGHDIEKIFFFFYLPKTRHVSSMRACGMQENMGRKVLGWEGLFRVPLFWTVETMAKLVLEFELNLFESSVYNSCSSFKIVIRSH